MILEITNILYYIYDRRSCRQYGKLGPIILNKYETKIIWT